PQPSRRAGPPPPRGSVFSPRAPEASPPPPPPGGHPARRGERARPPAAEGVKYFTPRPPRPRRILNPEERGDGSRRLPRRRDRGGEACGLPAPLRHLRRGD